MSATADSIYQLIKTSEGKFPIPAPYFSISVGTLNVDTGTFTGLTTTSETDPEPIEHKAGDRPISPQPHFVGTTWVSITIDSRWRRTTTRSPAPKAPLQPVLLVFSVSRPVPGGWSASANGETFQADSGQTTLSASIWDAAITPWSINAGGRSHSETIRIQRPAGWLGGALGGFTIPILPVTIIYAPPADSLGKSTATYTTGQSVGQTVTLDTSSDSSQTVPTSTSDLATFKQFLDYGAGKLAAVAAATDKVTGAFTEPTGAALAEAGLFSGLSSQLGQSSASETSGITDLFDLQMTVTTSTSTALSTTAAAGGQGAGDTFYFLHNVRMVWAYFEGQLRLTPLSYRNASFPATALQQHGSVIGVSVADAATLLALDPFVAGGPTATLPTDRFQLMETWEYGYGATMHKTAATTRDTKSLTTHTTYQTATSEWDAGPILKFFGFGEKDDTTTKLSNATGSDVSSTITMDAVLVSGPNDYFVVNIWYDALFGTFAFQSVPPASAARLRGQGAQPNQEVKLTAGGKVFTTVADAHGAYAFFARAIPGGNGVITIGTGPGHPVQVSA
jgi:hypothetical protein